MRMTVRIATRKSPLAIWQANYVKKRLLLLHPDLTVEVMGMLTTADKMIATPLHQIGGKGFFVKELEKAILEHQADIAVHSIKDMPSELPDGLELAAILPREDPYDVFVSNKYLTIFDLPQGGLLGTSSLRRKTQALAMRQDLNIKSLRGNVGSRLKKLDQEKFDAIILACAGLKRLGLEHRIKSNFNLNQMLPAAGQGAIGVECRYKDERVLNLLSPLNDQNTWDAVTAERIVSERLGGGCQFPIACYASIHHENLSLQALVSNFDGSKILRTTQQGSRHLFKEVALSAANDLITQGALELLQQKLTTID
jgi:hydroxymethylbilane synthase